MKKKLFLIVIAVLVVALMCGVLLVACDDNNDPPTPPPPAGDGYPYTENVGTVLEMIIDNLDAEAKADNGEIAVAMELKSEGKVLFGLAFEELGGEQIMYAALNSNVYAKFNGFNLGEVVESALGLITNPDGSLNIPGVDLSKVLNGALANIKLNAESVKSLIELIVTFGILADNGVVHDANEEVLTVTLDLASIVGLVGGFVKADTLAGLFGIYKMDDKGNYIDAEGNITTDPEKYVANGAVIDKYINQYALSILPELPKNGEGNYTGGLSGIFTYIAELAAKAQFDITFATGSIVRDDTQNPFIGTSVGTAREKDAVNLLTFNVDGSFNAYPKATSTSKVEGEGEDAKTETDIKLEGDKSVYDIQIDGSLDPFVAIELLNHYIASVKAGNGDKLEQDKYWDENFPAVMKSMLSKVGYLQITVDETDASKKVTNILTLSFNSEDGYILANANIHAAAGNELDENEDGWISLGGTYDMDTFVDYLICVMEGNKIGAGAAADGEGSIIDTIIGYIPTILDLVKKNAVITGEELDGEVIADGVALNLGVLVDGAFNMILEGLGNTDKEAWLNTWDGFVKALVSASIGTDGNIDFGMLNGIQGIEIKFADWSAAFGNAEFRDLTKLDAYKGIVSDIAAGENAAVTKSGDVYTISGSFTVTKLGDTTPVTVQAEDLVLIAAEEVFDANGEVVEVIAFVASPSEITKALANWEGQTQKVVYPFSGMHAIAFEVKA